MTDLTTLQAQYVTARAALRRALNEWKAEPCEATELTVASRGATVCALEAKITEETRRIATVAW